MTTSTNQEVQNFSSQSTTQEKTQHSISNCVHFLEEADLGKLTLLYPVGKQVGIRDVRSNEMGFIRLSDKVKEITAMSMSPGQRYLAVAEIQSTDKSCYISFHDRKSNFLKHLRHPLNVCENQSPTNQKFITSIAFSNDSMLIGCILNAPDCKVLIFDWKSKSRLTSQLDFYKQQVTKLTFFPRDTHKVVLSGQGIFQQYSIQQENLKVLVEFKKMPKQRKLDEEIDYTDHVWMGDDHLVGCTNQGDIFVIDQNSEVIQSFYDQKSNYVLLHSYSLGFCAATDTGIIKFFKYNLKGNVYENIFNWSKCNFLRSERVISMNTHDTSQLSEVYEGEIYLAICLKNQNVIYLEIAKQIYSKKLDERDKDGDKNNLFPDTIEDDDKDELDSQIAFEFLGKGFHSGSITCMDISVQRSIIVTCSQQDCTIRIWNYYTGQQELTRVFFSQDKDTQKGINTKRTLHSCAMHPSGYYMAAGFQDRIRVMHILNDQLRDYKTIEIKSCKKMKFSNGGHILACVDYKDIHLYSSYTLEPIAKLKCTFAAKMSDISFNDNDTQLVTVSKEGFIQRYDLVKFTSKGEALIDKNCNFRSCVFFKEEQDSKNEEEKVIVVGSENGKSHFRVYNDQETMEISKQVAGMKKFTEVCLIKSFQNGIQNLILGTGTGQINVYGLPPFLAPEFTFDSFNAHCGEIISIVASPDGRFVFSAGADGVIFVYGVSEFANETTIIKQELPVHSKNEEKIGQMTSAPQLNLVIDEQLAQIVLVKKSLMEGWRKQQEQLSAEIEELTNKVDEERKKIQMMKENEIKQLNDTMTKKLEELKKRYADLQNQETEQKEDNTQTMKKMELNHQQWMEELQSMYEKKLSIENQNYMALEKEKGEMRTEYENEIKHLQRQNEDAIETLLNEFKNNLQKVQDEYEDSKRTGDGLKMMYEEKLTQQEDEHEAEIGELKTNYKSEKEKLDDIIGTLKNEIETTKRQIKRIEEEKSTFDTSKEKYDKKKSHLDSLLEQKMKEIETLVSEKKEVQDKLKKKETELYKYKFKIKDLQKTKQVLAHRTQEMKSSLEPKEQQINNLKEQLLDLEKVFEKQSKSMQSLQEDVERREQKIKELDVQVEHEKNSTKLRDKKISGFVNDIHKIVQMKDEKSYVTGLILIYDRYVKEYSDEILEKKKKDPETIEELDRQLRYMEKSITTLKQNTTKNEMMTKTNIKEKTGENTKLIKELNELRDKKRELETELEGLQLKFQKLNLEIKRKRQENEKRSMGYQMNSSYMQKSKEGLHESPSGNQYYTRPKSGATQDGLLPKVGQPAQVGITSQKSKGRLFKGTPFNFLKGNLEDKNRLNELIGQLEDNNQQILLQKLEIRSLKDQIIKLLEDRGGIQELGEDGGSRVQTSGQNKRVGQGESHPEMAHSSIENSTQLRVQSRGRVSGMNVNSQLTHDKESFLPKVDGKK